MATLTVQEIEIEGLTFTTAAASAGGDAFENNGDVALYVDNGSGGSIDVTFTAQRAPSGLDLTDPSGSVPAGEAAMFGPFPARWFNDNDGRVQVTYSAVSSVTVAALKLPPRI